MAMFTYFHEGALENQDGPPLPLLLCCLGGVTLRKALDHGPKIVRRNLPVPCEVTVCSDGVGHVATLHFDWQANVSAEVLESVVYDLDVPYATQRWALYRWIDNGWARLNVDGYETE